MPKKKKDQKVNFIYEVICDLACLLSQIYEIVWFPITLLLKLS